MIIKTLYICIKITLFYIPYHALIQYVLKEHCWQGMICHIVCIGMVFVFHELFSYAWQRMPFFDIGIGKLHIRKESNFPNAQFVNALLNEVGSNICNHKRRKHKTILYLHYVLWPYVIPSLPWDLFHSHKCHTNMVWRLHGRPWCVSLNDPGFDAFCHILGKEYLLFVFSTFVQVWHFLFPWSLLAHCQPSQFSSVSF